MAVVGQCRRNLGDGVAFVAIPLVATSLTTNPTSIAGLALTYSATRMLLVVPVGVVVDRVDRRLLMWLPNVLRGLILLALSLAFAVGLESLPLLYAAFALVGVMEIAADNAALSVLPDLVEPDDLDRANGRIATAQLVADEFVGPSARRLPVRPRRRHAPRRHGRPVRRGRGSMFLAIPRQTRPAAAPGAAGTRASMWRDASGGCRVDPRRSAAPRAGRSPVDLPASPT